VCRGHLNSAFHVHVPSKQGFFLFRDFLSISKYSTKVLPSTLTLGALPDLSKRAEPSQLYVCRYQSTQQPPFCCASHFDILAKVTLCVHYDASSLRLANSYIHQCDLQQKRYRLQESWNQIACYQHLPRSRPNVRVESHSCISHIRNLKVSKVCNKYGIISWFALEAMLFGL
jgi:hypothetical protein